MRKVVIAKSKNIELASTRNYCKHFNSGLQNCTSGCPTKDIKAKGPCPWSDNDREAEDECPCYK